MVKAIGTDIVNIKRIEQAIERSGVSFVERILTPLEQKIYRDKGHCSRYFAKRFAAKEAAVKALGTGIGHGISWQHIQVENNELGQPYLVFVGPAAERQLSLGSRFAHLSIADEQEQAMAFVVLS